MSSRHKIILSIVSAVVLLILIFVIWFDWNMLKPYIERQVTEKTGREFLIRGDLDVNLSFNPLVTVLNLGGRGYEERLAVWDLIFLYPLLT